MIEVNKRAKPFHPCESLLGTELLFLTKRCQLIGRNYYAPAHPTSVKDVMCQFKPSLVANGLSKGLKKYGFYEKLTNPNLTHFYQFIKEDGENLIQMYAAPNTWMYDELSRAQEICKYLQFFTGAGVVLNKELVIDIHQLNSGLMGCRSVNDGAEVELFALPVPQEDMPIPAAPQGGHHHWHPHAQFQADAQAAHEAQGGLPGGHGVVAGNWAAQGAVAGAGQVVHVEPAGAGAAQGGGIGAFINQILGG